MGKLTDQIQEWSGDFGREYTDRNDLTAAQMDELYQRRFGLTRTALNLEFLGDLPRSLSILEVGTNLGTQLVSLQQIGFTNLYGLELQAYAVDQAQKRTRHINIIQGSAFDIPFKDRFFDLVFTSGMLIHINPHDLQTAMTEIRRCARSYIWGTEYFSDGLQEVKYHGKSNLMWKGNYAALYLQRFGDLQLIREKKLVYRDSENVDSMFLLGC